MSILDNIQARADKASKGPWAVDHDDFDGASVYMDDGITWGRAYVCSDLQQGEDEGRADAAFIAHARADIPALVAALRAVEAVLDEDAKAFRETSDRLTQEVIDRHPDRDTDAAARYVAYAAAAARAAHKARDTIAKALESTQ